MSTLFFQIDTRREFRYHTRRDMRGVGKRLSLESPAKVNLHLDVLGRRSDGYHEIVSLFQAVNLFDHLTFRSLKEREALRIEGDFPFPVSQNLVASAVRLFRKRTGIESGISIRVRKRIPIGAGLGAGSSNAAAVLQGLNQLHGALLSSDELKGLALQLGSDVPFFLNGPAALVTGRGETLRQLPGRVGFFLVLVYPGFSISTADAYRWFDEAGGEGGIQRLSQEELAQRYCNGSVEAWGFANAFQRVIEQRYPPIREISARLRSGGSLCTCLSGSGSAVFGVFTSRSSAQESRRLFKRVYPMAAILEPLKNG